MIRVDPSNWTADFRIGRALAEAFDASGLDDIVFFCVGDPKDPIGMLGSLVADETQKYFPNVVGLSDNPVTAENFRRQAEEAVDRWPNAFIIAIEAGQGVRADLGSVEITDRPLSSVGHLDIVPYFGDVTVNAVLHPVEDVNPFRRQAPGRPTGAKGLQEAVLEVGSDDEPIVGRKKFKPLLPEQINASVVRKIADVIIDGNLRFLSRIGKQEI